MRRSKHVFKTDSFLKLAFAVLLALCATAGLGQRAQAQCLSDFWVDTTKAMRPLTSDPIEPGGTIEMTLHICNSGTEDPIVDCGFPIVSVQDELNGHYDLVNPVLRSWSSTVWQNSIGPGCNILPDGALLCMTERAGAFGPGDCTDIVLEADVSLSIPKDEVCNQACIVGSIMPPMGCCDPRGGSIGCTSPDTAPDTQRETCLPVEITLDLGVDKRIVSTSGGTNPTVFEPGDTINYEVCAHNDGTAILQLVNLKDYVPEDASSNDYFVDQLPDCVTNFTQTPNVNAAVYSSCSAVDSSFAISGAGPNDFWLYPSGSPSGPNSVCFTYSLLTVNTIPNGTNVCNHIEATWQGKTGGPLVFPDVCETASSGPVMEGTKDIQPRDPNPGDPVTFTIHVVNAGIGPSTLPIRVTDVLKTNCFDLTGFVPATDISFSPAAPASWSAILVGGNTLQIDIDDSFAAGETLDIIFTLNIAASATGHCTNTAQISSLGATPEFPPVSTTDPLTHDIDTGIDIGGVATLEATKVVQPTGFVNPGAQLTYTVTFTNTGTRDATDVTFADTLDAGLDCASFTYLSGPPAFTVDCGTRLVSAPAGFVVPVVPPTTTIQFRVDVDADALPGPLCNDAQITYLRVATNPASRRSIALSNPLSERCVTVNFIEDSDFTFSKDVANLAGFPRNQNLGGQVRYELRVENTGNAEATMVHITDTFAACLDITALNAASLTAIGCNVLNFNLTGRTMSFDIDVVPIGTPPPPARVLINNINIDAAATPDTDCDNTATLAYKSRTWNSDDPDQPGTTDPTRVHINPVQANQLRRMGVTDTCPLTAKPANMATYFPPTLVVGGPLPWNFAGDLPSPPGSDSCLIFYQSDDPTDTVIYAIKGDTPANDVKLTR